MLYTDGQVLYLSIPAGMFSDFEVNWPLCIPPPPLPFKK